MAFVPTAIPWSPEHQTQSLQVTRKQLETEEQAAFPLGGASPRHLYLACKQNNKWGHPRGYRIQMIGAPGEPLPRTSPLERAVSWGRWVGCIVGGGGCDDKSVGRSIWEPSSNCTQGEVRAQDIFPGYQKAHSEYTPPTWEKSFKFWWGHVVKLKGIYR